METIGILGGMGPQASAKLLDLIIRKTPQFTEVAFDDDFPEIVLLNVRVPNFIESEVNFDTTKKILKQKTRLLKKAGCTINAIACNTAHLFLPDLQKVTDVPFVAIPDAVAERISKLGFKKVGLLGTPNTLKSSMFDDALKGIEVVRPSNEIAAFCESLIFAQIAGKITTQQCEAFRDTVREFKSANKCDAVILGCTELPLIFGEENMDESILDTLEILADKLTRVYFNRF